MAEPGVKRRTILDRSIATILNKPDETPSRGDGVSAATERLHRLHGISLISSACELLKLPASCYASASTVFHRFFHRVSLKEHDVWSIAMASTMLAAKTEEITLPLRKMILIYAHLYRRRCLIIDDQDCLRILQYPAIAAWGQATKLSREEKEKKLKDVPVMSPLGPIWKEWYTSAVESENQVLRQLGFTLHWIPDSHPHKFLLYFLRVLEIDDTEFAQCAWNYCNDFFRLDLCVRFEPEVLACAAIYLASLDFGWELPTENDEPWWQVFCGPAKEGQISEIANAILGLLSDEVDVLAGSKGFVKSLIPAGSFNDAESFVWESSGL